MIDAVMACLCVFVVVASCSWIGGLIVFGPLHERTLLFRIRNRFRIADIISLGVLLQVAAGVVLALVPSDENAARITLTLLISLIVVTWWINGLRMLSRAGVERGSHRAAFLLLVLPSGYLCIILVLSTIILFPAAMELLTRARNREAWEIALAIFFLVLPIAGVTWGIICHRVCRRMADRARSGDSPWPAPHGPGAGPTAKLTHWATAHNAPCGWRPS